MDYGLCPHKWRGCLLVSFHKAIYGVAELANSGAAQVPQGLTTQDAEPDLDHIQPGRIGGDEVKPHLRMPRQPAVLLGLVGVEVIQNDVNLFVGMLRDHVIHEVEEFSSPSPRVMSDLYLADRYLKSSKECTRAVPLVAVAEPVQGFAIGKMQPALRSLQN